MPFPADALPNINGYTNGGRRARGAGEPDEESGHVDNFNLNGWGWARGRARPTKKIRRATQTEPQHSAWGPIVEERAAFGAFMFAKVSRLGWISTGYFEGGITFLKVNPKKHLAAFRLEWNR